MTRGAEKTAACIVGLLFGVGLLLRWVRRGRRKREMDRLRSIKQWERQIALENMEQLTESSQMETNFVKKITDLDIGKLLEQLQKGQLTALEVLRAYQIKAIEVHKKTNCLVEPIVEAEEWARELDQRQHRGPLHGLPISIKDCIAIKGYDSTVGCSKWIHQPFVEDSVLIQVLKKQGAVPFVKTNIPQTMMSWETTNPIFGLTVHPLDHHRTAGGSSGGEGALIAGGGSLCGVGTDLGGSIRIPGAVCGVPAFKPTALRVSKKGRRDILPGKSILTSWGPLAQSVDGLIAFMMAVLVPEMYELDPSIPVMPFRKEVLNDKRSLRLGYFLFNGVSEVVPAVVRAVEEAKKILEASGYELVPWNIHFTEEQSWMWYQCITADGGKEMFDILEFDEVDDAVRSKKAFSSIPRWIRKLVAFLLKPINPGLSLHLKASCGYDNVSGLWELNKELKNMQMAVVDSWQKLKLDGVLCPAMECPAVSTGLPKQLKGITSYFELFNLVDFPAGCIPVSVVTAEDVTAMLDSYPTLSALSEVHELLKKDLKGAIGLPLAVQVATLPYQDELCLRIMKDVENGVKQKLLAQ